MNNPLIMHINYCEQGQSVEETCKKAAEWGADGVEFRRVSAALKYDSRERYLDDIAEGVSRHGLGHVVFGCQVSLAQADKGARDREVADAAEFFSSALSRFPLSVVNVMAGGILNPDPAATHDYERQGSFIATGEQWVWAADGFRELGAFALGKNFKMAFESHMYYLHDTPANAKRLADMVGSPAVGVNLDYGNAVYFSPKNTQPLPEAIKTLGGSLFYLHLKNSVAIGGARMPTLLADGEINHREYLRLVRDSGFDGPICVEAPRPGDREWFAAMDLAYARELMTEL